MPSDDNCTVFGGNYRLAVREYHNEFMLSNALGASSASGISGLKVKAGSHRATCGIGLAQDEGCLGPVAVNSTRPPLRKAALFGYHSSKRSPLTVEGYMWCIKGRC
jgi:hypothetical protein